jgi:hypothetical protein
MENEFMFRSTPKYKKYNKMWRIDGEDDVDANDDDGDDDQSL